VSALVSAKLRIFHNYAMLRLEYHSTTLINKIYPGLYYSWTIICALTILSTMQRLLIGFK